MDVDVNVKVKIKSLIFTTILIVLIFMTRSILANPKGTTWAMQTGLDEIHKYKNSYDICFLGTSVVIANICNQELYEKYGIAGVSLGEPEQPLYLTKYTLKETLQYQAPGIVFLDTKAMFYSDENARKKALESEDYIVHNSLDGIKTLSVKNEALQAVKLYKEDLDFWNYYSKLYYTHENWKNLTYRNFKKYDSSDCMNGNIVLSDICENITNIYDNNDKKVKISKAMEQEFCEIADLCKESGTELVLITSYVLSNKGQHEAIQNLAKKYNIKYIDINEHTEEIDFSYNIDLNDAVHFNLSGAVKWTDYLGKYLLDNYQFADRRTDFAYNRYKEQSGMFEKQKNLIYNKQSLLQSMTFNDYLETLNKLDKTENAVFISVFGEAISHLTKKERTLLSEMGLKTNFKDMVGNSYASVVYGENAEEREAHGDVAEINGVIGKMQYTVVGDVAGDGAGILINNVEMMQKGSGFNFVIYNTEFNTVINSAYFDTLVYKNPIQSRRTSEENMIEQYEADLNVWVNR